MTLPWAGKQYISSVMKVTRGRIPPGGWHFILEDGKRIEAPTEEMLTDAIFESRMRRGIPIGDIRRDIDDYYCSRWPEHCQKEAHEYANTSASVRGPSDEPMLNRIARWASILSRKMPKGGYTLTTEQEATKRAAICIGCPFNVEWRTGCPGCSSSTASLLASMRNIRKLSCDGRLHGCKVIGWDNATAVHFEKREPLTEDQSKQVCEKCWAK